MKNVILCTSIALTLFSSGYSQNGSGRYQNNYYQNNRNPVAQNNDSDIEPTRIYPTERGSTSSFNAYDQNYQSYGYPDQSPASRGEQYVETHFGETPVNENHYDPYYYYQQQYDFDQRNY